MVRSGEFVREALNRLPALRPYQVEVGRAVMASVRQGLGHTITVEIARQGGKNELSAQLEVLLLTLHMAGGGSGVKCAPTFTPQAAISMDRLKARLNDAGFAGRWAVEHGYVLRLGRARQAFYSADAAANVVGATADLLLEVDEAQDVDTEVYRKRFRPMGASRNVTTVLWGTPWHGETLLEHEKQTNLALEQADGLRRHFRYDWQAVAASHPAYGRYVAAEAQRLGEDHPLFRTQYRLEPLSGGRGFLSAQQRAWLQGDHLRWNRPEGPGPFVAGIDVAGEAEGGGGPLGDDAAVRVREPRRDSTVVTIAQLDYSHTGPLAPDPAVRVVEHLWWTGRSHASLGPELAGLLRDTWHCRSVVVDATGLGQGVASMLARLMGSVVRPLVFSAESKSRLGFGLLAAVNAGRLKVYGEDGDAWRELWRQLDRTQVRYGAGQRMNFFVDEREGHDDFVMSLALAVEAAGAYVPRQARGRLNNDD